MGVSSPHIGDSEVNNFDCDEVETLHTDQAVVDQLSIDDDIESLGSELGFHQTKWAPSSSSCIDRDTMNGNMLSQVISGNVNVNNLSMMPSGFCDESLQDCKNNHDHAETAVTNEPIAMGLLNSITLLEGLNRRFHEALRGGQELTTFEYKLMNDMINSGRATGLNVGITLQ